MTLQINNDTLSTVARIYNRSEDSFDDDVQTLKAWMKTQPHLPEILDDTSLRNFLILNKCSIERAKSSIDMYYTLRGRIPDLYEDVNPKCKNMQQAIDMLYYVPSVKLTENSYRVIFFKLRRKDMIDRLVPQDAHALANSLQEVRLKEDVMFGDVAVYDMEGLTLGYLTKLTPTFLSKISVYAHEIFSVPTKKIYIINSHSYISKILLVLKTLLKPKIFERIKVCEDASILHEGLPKDVIPKDYGGEGPSLEELQELWKAKLVQYQRRFDELDTFKVTESLRPQKLENDEVLGFHGNFKKLSVD